MCITIFNIQLCNYQHYAETKSQDVHHFSVGIRSLQCILLKISLLLGLSFHAGVEFLQVLEPNADT